MIMRISPALTLLLTAALMASLALPAAAHGAPHQEVVQAGPYRLEIDYTIWPLRARANLDLVIHPEGGGAGKSMLVKVIPPPGAGLAVRTSPLTTHQTVPGAYTVYNLNLAAPGSWKFEFLIDGPQGRGSGATTTLEVAGAARGLPPAAGWLVSLTPLAALVWFLVREQRRVARAMAADGGARA